MADIFANVADKTAPASRWFLIAPNDGADLEILPRAIICAQDGSIEAIDAQGAVMTLDLIAGAYVPIRPTRVGTGSTGIFYALY